MRHPTEGVLRRLLDEPAGVADTDRAHVAGCAECLDELAAAREDAALVGAALRTGHRRRRRRRLAAARRRAGDRSAPGRPAAAGRLRAVLRRPATAAVALTVALGGAGIAAANDWLPIFRTEQVAPVTFGAGPGRAARPQRVRHC